MKKFNPADWKPQKPVAQKQYKPVAHARQTGTTNSVSRDVDVVVRRIENVGADIAPTYADWLALGFALASEFGESGRGYFHRCSMYYAGYTPEATEKQYDNCLRSRGHGVSIKTFFQLAKNAGININTKRNNE